MDKQPQRFYDWFNDWKENRPTERLGQAFINDFIRSNWIELYNEEDIHTSMRTISEWLKDHSYYDEIGFYMPEKIK